MAVLASVALGDYCVLVSPKKTKLINPRDLVVAGVTVSHKETDNFQVTMWSEAELKYRYKSRGWIVERTKLLTLLISNIRGHKLK